MSLSSGTFKITNVAVGLPLAPQSLAAGSNIIVNKDDMSDQFKWIFQLIAGQTFYISSLAAPTIFAYGGNNILPPTEIKTGTNNQMFNITAVPGVTDTYTITTVDSGVYWSVQAAIPSAKVITSPNGFGQLQQFVIKRQ